MKKIITAALMAALILSLCACSNKKEENKKAPVSSDMTVPVTDPISGETVAGEGEYEWNLVSTQIIGPDGKPVEALPEEFQKIEEGATVQSIEDITNLDELVAGYALCHNYDFSYDDTVIFNTSYLITDAEAVAAFKSECAKYFIEGVYPICYTELEGNSYYSPVENDISLTLEKGSDGSALNYSSGDCCEVSFTDNFGNHISLEFTKTDKGFLISYITVG